MKEGESDRHYDVLVIGGGLVGASLAVSLAQPMQAARPLRIGVIEACPLPEDVDREGYQPSFDARSTAISWGTRLIYEQLGIWPHLSGRAEAILNIHVSDRGGFGATRLSAREMNCEALGYVVENQWIGLNLMLAVEARKEINWICPADVQAVIPETNCASVVVEQAGVRNTLSARLVVLADGGRSTLRQDLGIGVDCETYGQHALIANVQVQKPHQGWAFERFTAQGPMAMLPLPDAGKSRHRMALVWTLPDSEASHFSTCEQDELIQTLQERFGFRLGRILDVGKRFSYPLKLELAREQVRPRLAVVGNAAHALHPVAGQGYNLALRGAMALSDIIRSAWERGAMGGNTGGASVDIGGLALLNDYQSWHASDQFRTTLFSDQLVKLFSNKKAGLSTARDVGLIGLDLALPAKKLFMKQAMGLG